MLYFCKNTSEKFISTMATFNEDKAFSSSSSYNEEIIKHIEQIIYYLSALLLGITTVKYTILKLLTTGTFQVNSSTDCSSWSHNLTSLQLHLSALT